MGKISGKNSQFINDGFAHMRSILYMESSLYYFTTPIKIERMLIFIFIILFAFIF